MSAHDRPDRPGLPDPAAADAARRAGHPSPAPEAADQRLSGPERRRAWLIAALAIGLPAAAALGASLLARTWLGALPETVATHWALDGRADGFSPAALAVWFPALFGVPLAALLGGIAVSTFISRAGRGAYAGLGALSMAVAGPVMAGMLGTIATQRVGAEGSGSGPAWIAAGIGLAIAAGVWLALWRVQPRVRRAYEAGDGERPVLALEPGERAAFHGRVWTSSAMLVALVALVVVPLGFLAWTALASGRGAAAIPFGVILPVAISLLLAATLAWRVRVDAEGVRLSGLFGLPRVHTPPRRCARRARDHGSPPARFRRLGDALRP